MTEYTQYRKILQHYGIDGQLKKLVEELSELIEVIENKNEYGSNTKWLRHLNDEIADVEVVIEQIKIYFKSHDVIDTIKVHKVERTIFEIDIEQSE